MGKCTRKISGAYKKLLPEIIEIQYKYQGKQISLNEIRDIVNKDKTCELDVYLLRRADQVSDYKFLTNIEVHNRKGCNYNYEAEMNKRSMIYNYFASVDNIFNSYIKQTIG